MTISLPELSLVVLIGPSGSGKSSFARKHFLPTEIVSSDVCRGLVSDDENDQTVSAEAFSLLHQIIEARLRLGRLTVVDATNVDPAGRKSLIELARKFHFLPSAIVFQIPEKICHMRNKSRPDRNFGPHVIKRQLSILRRGLKGLKREGFRKIHRLQSEEEVNEVTGISREKLWNNRKDVSGPFDIIGDVHGCYDELRNLLETLGYTVTDHVANHPARQLVFVGDLIDRGPNSPDVLRLVMHSVSAGTAHCVPGNHDAKLLRKLNGKNVTLTHGLDLTMEQLENSPIDEIKLRDFLDSLVSHLVFDDGRLVVAHAGIKEEMIGRGSGAIREMCLYGDTTGEKDEQGLPVRLDWAAGYRGNAQIVYGHTPVEHPRWLNKTVNIDTGCVFGGTLTALRYPENETVSIPAAKTYAEPGKPFKATPGQLTDQQENDIILDISAVIGRRIVDTRYLHNMTIREKNSIAALEVMSRFAVDPRWLIHLPPTMSPCATSEAEGWLERPEEAFLYYKDSGVEEIICEEKHMGSRAVITLVRDKDTARTRFGISDGSLGVITSRTGRPFFKDQKTANEILKRFRSALDKTDFWTTYDTNWACIDCEIMPWSAKARDLLTSQYAPVGAVASAFADAAVAVTDGSPHEDIQALHKRSHTQARNITGYRKAYGHYCWDTPTLDDYRIAPFHLLATEGHVHIEKNHTWHMAFVDTLSDSGDALFQKTLTRTVDLNNPEAVSSATKWWESLTATGGEGMVVKPSTFLARNSKGILQPAVKCRGREYLRIIYGPEYTEPDNLKRLKSRGLNRKRSLALREFSLGLEALHRFVERAPLRKVHECVFAVLALESEPVDPRL